ncbi:MAG: YkvA family protein [Pseudomonadota bacterium]
MASSSDDFTNKYGRFRKHYSESDFWSRLKGRAKKLGKGGLKHALTLYYTLNEPNVPTWAKTVIIGALGYFIFPLDAIPDFVPFVGLTDDLGVLTAARVDDPVG